MGFRRGGGEAKELRPWWQGWMRVLIFVRCENIGDWIPWRLNSLRLWLKWSWGWLIRSVGIRNDANTPIWVTLAQGFTRLSHISYKKTGAATVTLVVPDSQCRPQGLTSEDLPKISWSSQPKHASSRWGCFMSSSTVKGRQTRSITSSIASTTPKRKGIDSRCLV
jgi:hypothetical protein